MIDKAIQQNRDRVKKHLEQKKNEGFRRLSCFISSAAFERLQALKQEAGQSTGDLIESLIATGIYPCKEKEPAKQITEDIHTDVKENDADILEPDPEETVNFTVEPEETAMAAVQDDRDTPEQSEPGKVGANFAVEHQHQQPLIDLSKYDLTNLTITDRDQITLELYEAYPDRTHAQMRIDFLNQNGILLNGSPWTKKQLTDQLCRARERQKARQGYK